MEIVKGYNIPNLNCSETSIEKIKANLDELEILKITIDGVILLSDRQIVMSDLEKPIMLVDNSFYNNSLCIDKEYYKMNQEKINELIIYICKNTKQSSIKIDEPTLITDEVINAILENPNLKEITLGNRDEAFILTKELFEKFKGTHITSVMTYGVDDSLKENFDPLIKYNSNRNLIGYNNYDSLVTSEVFFLNQPLKEEEMQYLKYINKKARINLSSNDYESTFKCINGLRDSGHTGLITIDIEEKNGLNNYIFSNIDKIKNTNNVEVNLNGSIHSLTTYMKYEKRLIDLILPAINLSPFEKYLYAYNVTKKFKKYKENDSDRTSARNLYQLLDNEFMVCVGYSKLLGDLLDKLGIENHEESVSVDIGLDRIPDEATILPDYVYDEKTKQLKAVETEGTGHSRRAIHLIDPKYGIDGYYYADPTWDNDMTHDTYNYALMTEEEYVGIDRYNYYNIYGINELFFVHSLEEFYLKINIYLDKNRKKTEVDIISSLLYYFKEFDNELYRFINNKYPGISGYNKKFTKEEIQDIFLDIGERIVRKSDNLVDGNLFKEGITAIYRDVEGLNGEELENKVNEILEYNKKRHAKCFPVRYKVDKDDNKLVILNVNNKFDLESQPELRV